MSSLTARYGWGRGQVPARLTVFAALLLFGTCLRLGGSLGFGAASVLLTLAVASSVWPRTLVVLLLIAEMGYLWVLEGPDRLNGWVLGAAAALITVHVTTTLLALVPHAGDLGRELVVLWARRAGLAWSVALVVWLAALVASRLPASPVAFGLGVGVVATGCAVAAVRLRGA